MYTYPWANTWRVDQSIADLPLSQNGKGKLALNTGRHSLNSKQPQRVKTPCPIHPFEDDGENATIRRSVDTVLHSTCMWPRPCPPFPYHFHACDTAPHMHLRTVILLVCAAGVQRRRQGRIMEIGVQTIEENQPMQRPSTRHFSASCWEFRTRIRNQPNWTCQRRYFI